LPGYRLHTWAVQSIEGVFHAHLVLSGLLFHVLYFNVHEGCERCSSCMTRPAERDLPSATCRARPATFHSAVNEGGSHGPESCDPGIDGEPEPSEVLRGIFSWRGAASPQSGRVSLRLETPWM